MKPTLQLVYTDPHIVRAVKYPSKLVVYKTLTEVSYDNHEEHEGIRS